MGTPDPCGSLLVQAAGLSGKVFGDRKGRDVKRRITEMAEASVASGQWTSDGVRKAIEEVEGLDPSGGPQAEEEYENHPDQDQTGT